MIDREPVDIMGVIAFPNPNKDERVIHFIDSEYHTLFTRNDTLMLSPASCGNAKCSSRRTRLTSTF